MVSSSAWSQMLSQKVALYANVCIHVTEKMLSFLTILCSEIAERFGLPLLENSPRQTVRRECFSQELPLPSYSRGVRQPRGGHCQPSLLHKALSLCSAGLQQAGSASYKPSRDLTSPEGGTPAPVASAAKPEPRPKEKLKPESEPWPKEKPEPESQLKEKPEPESQLNEKPELEPRPEEEPEEEPRPEEESELELWPEEEPELENEPESQPEEEPESKKEPKHDKKPVSRSVLCYEFSLLGKKAGTCGRQRREHLGRVSTPSWQSLAVPIFTGQLCQTALTHFILPILGGKG